ncbi:hypothetical protein IKW75_00170 [Candidatus Saccharibacteria bacterium]|nr:hypothetical protein [Candidatus Saccharibacteria bacterium]
MNVAEWIIVGILAATLFIFLIIGIIFLIKSIKLVNQLNRIVKSGQDLADKANSIADNFKGAGAAVVGGLVNAFTSKYNKGGRQSKKGGYKDDEE